MPAIGLIPKKETVMLFTSMIHSDTLKNSSNSLLSRGSALLPLIRTVSHDEGKMIMV